MELPLEFSRHTSNLIPAVPLGPGTPYGELRKHSQAHRDTGIHVVVLRARGPAPFGRD